MKSGPVKDLRDDLKGRVTEILVEHLLRLSGYRCKRFGHEWRATALSQYGSLTEKDRFAPDYQITDKSGRERYLEVKYRWNAEFVNSDQERTRLRVLEKDWNSLIIMAHTVNNSPCFLLIEPPYFEDGVCNLNILQTGSITLPVSETALESCEQFMQLFGMIDQVAMGASK